MALPLYGDTPRPTIKTSRVAGTDDLWLVEVHIRQTNQRFASFQRVVRPERRIPLTLFGVETGVNTIEPPVLQRLEVDVEIRDGEVWFDPSALRSAYGRDIGGITTSAVSSPNVPVLVPLTPEERRLVHNLEQLGATPLEIITAQQNFRHNGDEETLASDLDETGASGERAESIRRAVRRARRSRDRAGVAYSSGDLPRAGDRWLRGTHQNAGNVPEEVAQRLRGRRFSSGDAFREAFWRAVADTPVLASQFTEANLREMRRGNAPLALPEQRHGRLVSYILHHRRPLSRDGELYDMSNIVVVSPRMHQDILDRRTHFTPPRETE